MARCPNPAFEVGSPRAYEPVLNPATYERDPVVARCRTCGGRAKVESVVGVLVQLVRHEAAAG